MFAGVALQTDQAYTYSIDQCFKLSMIMFWLLIG